MKRPMQVLFSTLLLALICAMPAPSRAAQAPVGSTSGGITEILLERTWCYGSCPVDRLLLRADGTAEYTGLENTPRTGRFTGKFWTGDFDQLAQWLVTEDFFALNARYGSPNVDTPDSLIRVVRGGESKSVINHSINHSLQVWGMENVIRAVAADIAWQPALSGVRGEARPNAWISIYPEKQGYAPSGMKERFAVRADAAGRFELALPAGTYGIAEGMRGTDTRSLAVESNRFTEVTLPYERAPIAPTSPPQPTTTPRPAYLPPPPPPGDGLYRHALLIPQIWQLNQGGRMYRLNEKAEVRILEKEITSASVDNTSFRLRLTIPWDEAVNPVSHYLIVNGTLYEMGGVGSRAREISILHFTIPDEAQARDVARYYDIPIIRFDKPDYGMRASITPAKPLFQRGEVVTATLRITNTGDEYPNFINAMGTERRDNYTFTARLNGRPVTDISFPGKPRWRRRPARSGAGSHLRGQGRSRQVVRVQGARNIRNPWCLPAPVQQDTQPRIAADLVDGGSRGGLHGYHPIAFATSGTIDPRNRRTARPSWRCIAAALSWQRLLTPDWIRLKRYSAGAIPMVRRS